MLLGDLLSLSAISMMAPEMFIWIPSFFLSLSLSFFFFFPLSLSLFVLLLLLLLLTFEVTNVDKHSACSTHDEEYCDDFPQKFHSLMQFGSQISFHHFSQSLTHARHLLHLMKLMGDHYTDHCQHSHVHCRSVYASHKPEIFSFLCHHMLAAIWLCLHWWILQQNTRSDIHTLFSYWHVQLQCDLTHTLKKQTTTVMPFEVTKWQNYFCDDNMSADKLWDRNFPHTAIPVNYTSKFQERFEATTYSRNFLKLLRIWTRKVIR